MYPKSIFLSVDVDDVDEVSAKAGVKGMPTYQTYKNGELVRSVTGAFKEELEQMVAQESSK